MSTSSSSSPRLQGPSSFLIENPQKEMSLLYNNSIEVGSFVMFHASGSDNLRFGNVVHIANKYESKGTIVTACKQNWLFDIEENKTKKKYLRQPTHHLYALTLCGKMLPKADRNIHTQIAKYEESLYRKKKVVMETHSHFEKIENEMRQNLKRTIETLNEDYAKKRKTYEEDFKNQIQKTNDEFETIISGIRKKREEAIIETKKQERLQSAYIADEEDPSFTATTKTNTDKLSWGKEKVIKEMEEVLKKNPVLPKKIQRILKKHTSNIDTCFRKSVISGEVKFIDSSNFPERGFTELETFFDNIPYRVGDEVCVKFHSFDDSFEKGKVYAIDIDEEKVFVRSLKYNEKEGVFPTVTLPYFSSSILISPVDLDNTNIKDFVSVSRDEIQDSNEIQEKVLVKKTTRIFTLWKFYNKKKIEKIGKIDGIKALRNKIGHKASQSIYNEKTSSNKPHIQEFGWVSRDKWLICEEEVLDFVMGKGTSSSWKPTPSMFK